MIKNPNEFGSNKGTQYNYWMLTWNNPPEDWRAALEMLCSDYTCGQLETGEGGTPHIQALLYYIQKRRPGAFKGFPVWIKGIPQRDVQKVKAYCSKTDTRSDGPYIKGECPQTGSLDYDLALQLTKEGRVLQIEAPILIRHYQNLSKLAAQFGSPNKTPGCRGHWLHGPPGTGKTHYAHETYPNAYLKQQNKWWDNYQGQEFVILDDFDQQGTALSHLLKIWTDKYGSYGEIKGAQVALRYSIFVVTSNYTPRELWPTDSILCDAIERRFEFKYFGTKYSKDLSEWLSSELPIKLDCSEELQIPSQKEVYNPLDCIEF